MNKPLSHTSISLYLQCPLKYKFRYVDRLKERPRAVLSFGKSVHEAIEFFFGSRLPKPRGLDEVAAHYENNWIKEGYKGAEEEKEYFEYGKTIIRDFCNKHTESYKVPLGVEHDIVFDVDGVRVKAIMDRIDKIGEGVVEIVDYKTNKDSFNLSELVNEPQLSMYQFAVEKEMGLRVERLTYYHLRSQTAFTIPRHSEEKIQALKDRIINVAQKIENKEFPYRENRFCPCDFGHLCPLYMHNYKKEAEKGTQAIDIVEIADEYGRLKDERREMDATIEALQGEIKEYMNREKIERVFGSLYEVTRSKTAQERLDTKKAKKILQEHNLIEGVLYRKESETIRYKERKETGL